MEILEYRKVYDEDYKREAYPWLHYLHKSPRLSKLILTVGIILIAFGLSIAMPAVANPYSWTNLQNMMGFSLLRLGFLLGVCFTILP